MIGLSPYCLQPTTTGRFHLQEKQNKKPFVHPPPTLRSPGTHSTAMDEEAGLGCSNDGWLECPFCLGCYQICYLESGAN